MIERFNSNFHFLFTAGFDFAQPSVILPSIFRKKGQPNQIRMPPQNKIQYV